MKFLTLATLCDSGDCLTPASIRCHYCGWQWCAPHVGHDGYCPDCGATFITPEVA